MRLSYSLKQGNRIKNIFGAAEIRLLHRGMQALFTPYSS